MTASQMKFIQRLHEPPSKTGTLAYTSLCTVVQAFPLAVIFWAIGRDDIYEETTKSIQSGAWIDYPFVFVLKAIVVTSLVAVVWHRYVLDSNFMAWRLSARDTLIPFGFAIAQCFLAMSIRGSDLKAFAGFFTLVTALGIFSYGNAVKQLRLNHSLALFKAHYGDPGAEVHECVLKYFTQSKFALIACTALNVVVFIACLLNLPRHADLCLVISVFMGEIIFHFVDNTTSRLEKFYSAEIINPSSDHQSSSRKSSEVSRLTP